MMRRFALIVLTAWGTAAYGQPNNQGFVPGHIFVSESEEEPCYPPLWEDSFVCEIVPLTGESLRAERAAGPSG